jgi:putative chitinase
MVSVSALIAAGIGPSQAKAFIDALLEVFDRFEINTPNREAAFVGQYAYESQNFTRLEENLFYRDPAWIMKVFPSRVKTLLEAKSLAGNPRMLANTVYAGKNGNGNFASGDGYRFRGRGLPQLTGRANYTAAALELHEPYLDNPDQVATVSDGTLVAGWYWNRTRCNQHADLWDIDSITRAINGPAMMHADKRRDWCLRALNAFR